MRTAIRWPFLGGLLAVIALVSACSGGGSANSRTQPIPTHAVFGSIRQVDFAAMPYARQLVDAAGGGNVAPERTVFADITGDGVEEAIVIVESGGTAGDLGAGVYRLVGGSPTLLRYIAAGGHVELRLGSVIVAQTGIYQGADPQCCPSKLREVSWGWDGQQLAIRSDQVIDNPNR